MTRPSLTLQGADGPAAPLAFEPAHRFRPHTEVLPSCHERPERACVSIEQRVLDLCLADHGARGAHLTLGRDQRTGRIVIAAVDAAPRPPCDVLRLFDRAGPGTGRSGSGFTWWCGGRTEAITVEGGAGWQEGQVRALAEALGIRIRPAQAGAARRTPTGGLLHRCGGALTQGGVTMAVLVGAVDAWLAAGVE